MQNKKSPLVLSLDSEKQLLELIGGEEISQEQNINAYSRLFILPDGKNVIKLFEGTASAKKGAATFDISFWGSGDHNLENAWKITSQLSFDKFPQLTLPSAFVSYKGVIVGYVMPFIEGTSLDAGLKSTLFTHQQKIGWFEQLATIIVSLPENIYIGDLHAQNVMVDKTGKIHLIDIDGFSLQDGWQQTCPAMYCADLPSKYYNESGQLKISRDTDILCLFLIFFQYLFDGWDIFCFSTLWRSRLSVYLERRGVGQKFADAVRRLFSDGANYLSVNLFESWYNLNVCQEYGRFLELSDLREYELVAEEQIEQWIYP